MRDWLETPGVLGMGLALDAAKRPLLVLATKLESLSSRESPKIRPIPVGRKKKHKLLRWKLSGRQI